MKKLINKYQLGGWFPIGYDNTIYRPTYGTLLPEVRVVAKGDPRKVNNDYYKAHSRARADAQSTVQNWDERDSRVAELMLSLISIPLEIEGSAQVIKNLPEFVLNVPKNSNRYYRYVGDDAIKDYIKTKTIRSSSANPNFNPPKIEGLLRRKKYDYNMFSKGEPWSGSLNASNKRKLNILVSKENTGKTVWEQSNVDFGHKGHSGIWRPRYEGDLNATPVMYFDYYKPRLIGYTKHSL
jgi:hypothetical protein